MNVIQGTNPEVQQWNRLLDTVVTIMKYNKSTIDNTTYIKVLSDRNFSYLIVYTDAVLNTTNNEADFIELGNVFE